jgi:hypothetical protein
MRLRWKIGIALLALVLLGAVGYSARKVVFHQSRSLQLEAWKAAGRPVRAADAAPEPVPADEDAAPLYLDAFTLLEESLGEDVVPFGGQVNP